MMFALLFISQAAVIVAVLGTGNIDALQRGRESLDIGSRVLTRMFDDRSLRLRSGVEILAADYGFKAAIATADTATLASVLANHGERIAADLVMLANTDGQLVASSHHNVSTHPGFPFPGVWEKAQAQSGTSAIVMLQGAPYQFVLVPVYAPNIIAWVGMGFLLDDAIAHTLGHITHLDVAFIGQQNTYLPYLSSTRTSHERWGLLDLPLDESVPNSGHAFMRHGDNYLSRQVLLGRTQDGQVSAILQMSRAALLAPYEHLKLQLLVIFCVTIIGALLMAYFASRTISRPLQRLTDTARRIGRGERVDPNIKDNGEIGLLASTLITMQDDLAQRETELLAKSRQDVLTGLPNRQSAELTIETLVMRQQSFVMQRVCINDFKQINDTFGYTIGDKVLIEMGQRLQTLAVAPEHVFRIGGDEYLLLYMPPFAPCDVRRRALVRLTMTPLVRDLSPVIVSLSAGEVHYPEHGDNAQILARRSEITLHSARRSAQKCLSYVPGMDENHLRQVMLINDLRDALQSNQLYMVYQPKIDVASGNVYEFEALIRWQHKTLGYVPPDEFIALAERSGNIGLLTDWVIEHVTRQLHDWIQQGQHFRVAINLSVHDLSNETLPKRIVQRIKDRGLDPNQLSLEITESTLMKDPVQATSLLSTLREHGFSIAIDDFGTGYSSLSQLRQLPIDELKIDKSFILKLDSQPEDMMIVRSTIDLGHNLGLKVTAEGVENAASLALLQEMGCDTAQGYFFARPLKVDQLPEWLENYRRHTAKSTDTTS